MIRILTTTFLISAILLLSLAKDYARAQESDAASSASGEPVPRGVEPEAWKDVRADIERRWPRSRIMSAGIFPVPPEGCFGYSPSDLSENPDAWYRGFAAAAAPCSLIVLTAQSDLVRPVAFVRREGEWQLAGQESDRQH